MKLSQLIVRGIAVLAHLHHIAHLLVRDLQGVTVVLQVQLRHRLPPRGREEDVRVRLPHHVRRDDVDGRLVPAVAADWMINAPAVGGRIAPRGPGHALVELLHRGLREGVLIGHPACKRLKHASRSYAGHLQDQVVDLAQGGPNGLHKDHPLGWLAAVRLRQATGVPEPLAREDGLHAVGELQVLCRTEGQAVGDALAQG
mmetsp:Transcript_64669/g.140853  ORF Transcript_64669/g.140853 Transcript_64669/m.140853 type:complete len:200 (-) Transcript_64669:1497-2096(-)